MKTNRPKDKRARVEVFFYEGSVSGVIVYDTNGNGLWAHGHLANEKSKHVYLPEAADLGRTKKGV